MVNKTDEDHLQQCLRLVEAKLGWGDSAGWSHYDFETLSETIWDQTGVRLSVTTLKRIWGKLKYESAPSLTTLNTLTRFIGYDDWRTYKQTVTACPEPPPSHFRQVLPPDSPPKRSDNQPKHLRAWIAAGIAILLAGGFSASLIRRLPVSRIDPEQFQFRANKVMTKGVPNSVVFQYDASAAQTDSVYIVQTWDIRRKTLVSKAKHEHSALYYYPGFFRTRLIVDGQTVKRHDLCINTDGWLGLIEQNPAPFYFQKADYEKKGLVEINESTLLKYGFSLYPQAPKMRFFNQQEMGNLMNDNFVFETWLKTDFHTGAGACQYVEVLIQCKDDIIIIPLAARNCIGDLSLYFCGQNVSSKEADLSGFGCDLTQWTKLRVETVARQATLYVNDVKAYSLTFPNDPAGIVGLQYRFDGVGAVKNTWFQHGNRIFRI